MWVTCGGMCFWRVVCEEWIDKKVFFVNGSHVIRVVSLEWYIQTQPTQNLEQEKNIRNTQQNVTKHNISIKLCGIKELHGSMSQVH